MSDILHRLFHNENNTEKDFKSGYWILIAFIESLMANKIDENTQLLASIELEERVKEKVWSLLNNTHQVW